MYNGIVVIDKPRGISSHTVISRMRKLLDQKKIGHGGTLDPMATGVLPIFAGRATRAAQYVQGSTKTYLARFRLGVTTDTQDITGTILKTAEVNISSDELLHAMDDFRGEILQLPPMYSAIQVDGQRLYKLAREGVEIERDARTVTIYDLKQEAEYPATNEYDILVTCSKGTFIRTLCADLGDSLGCGAAVTRLRRIKTGMFDINEAYTLEQIAELKENGHLDEIFMSPDMLFKELPQICVCGDAEERICRGAPVYFVNKDTGRYRVYGENNAFLGVGLICDTDRRQILSMEKGFFE